MTTPHNILGGAVVHGSTYWEWDTTTKKFKYRWRFILPFAKQIVEDMNEKGLGITLRQLFYRCVSAEVLPNTDRAYNALSVQTARARRKGRFPALIDQGRGVRRPQSWEGSEDAARWLSDAFRVNRAAGQPYAIYLACEKHGMYPQLNHWFGRQYGVPIITLGGYASQTFKDDVAWSVLTTKYDIRDGTAYRRTTDDGTPIMSVLIYAGDFDASGEDIPRDFIDHTERSYNKLLPDYACWDYVEHIALTPKQIEQFKLPPQPGKHSDARSGPFAEKYRELFEEMGMDLVQVELDALTPADLKQIYSDAFADWWSDEPYVAALAHEAIELQKVVANYHSYLEHH